MNGAFSQHLRRLRLGIMAVLAGLLLSAFAKPNVPTTPVAKLGPLPGATPPPKLSFAKTDALSAKPFWKAKPALLKKMAIERAIIVSVKREDSANGTIVFTMAGAGQVARDKDVCFKLAQDYPKLKEVSDHFRTVTYSPDDQKLFVITEALGYQARMLLKLTPVSEDWRSEVQWEVVWGTFKGMKGIIGFERVGPRSTEVSFTGRFEATELPIPKIVMGFALEVVTQKVAEKMRAYLEKNAP